MKHLKKSKILAMILVSFLSGGAAVKKPIDADEVFFLLNENGFITSWLVCGYFPNLPKGEVHVGSDGYAKDYLIQHGGEKGIQPEEGIRHSVGFQQFKWKLHIALNTYIDFSSLFNPSNNAVAYASCNIISPENREALIKLGSTDGIKIWLNNDLLHDHYVTRPARKDEDMVKVNLKQGANKVLVKMDQDGGPWGFYFKITDLQGNSIKNLQVMLCCYWDEEVMRKYTQSFLNISIDKRLYLDEDKCKVKVNLTGPPLVSLKDKEMKLRIKVHASDGRGKVKYERSQDLLLNPTEIKIDISDLPSDDYTLVAEILNKKNRKVAKTIRCFRKRYRFKMISPIQKALWHVSDWSSKGTYVHAENVDIQASPGEILLKNDLTNVVYAFDPTDTETITCMTVYKNKLFMGACTQPAITNTGEVIIYDYTTDGFEKVFTVSEQGIARMHVFNGKLFIPGHDATDYTIKNINDRTTTYERGLVKRQIGNYTIYVPDKSASDGGWDLGNLYVYDDKRA